MRQAPTSTSSSLPMHMSFIQLPRTNGRSDAIFFTLIFHEEREEIIMVRTFVLLAQKKIDKKEKEETEKRIVFSFFFNKVTLFFCNSTACRLDST